MNLCKIATPTLVTLPAADEFELSLFGPGKGESVVLHLGHGHWMIVDSCVEPGSKEPVSLKYLAALGVDAKSSVRLVVATHWHSDHIQGMAKVVEATPSADFYCSDALRNKEYISFLSATKKARGMAFEPPSGEMSKVFSSLIKRSGQEGVNWAVADQRLLYLPNEQIEVWAVSPSSTTVTRAKIAFADLLAGEVKQDRIPIGDGANHSAVALLIKADKRWMLLGADLEHTTNQNQGWSAVVASNTRPQSYSDGFKVAHHGSSGADCPGVWESMLHANPFAGVTPYSPSGLPRKEDIMRLKNQTTNVFCTAPSNGASPPKLDPAVERTMREVTGGKRRKTGKMGHIRVRTKTAGDATGHVELFGGAYQA